VNRNPTEDDAAALVEQLATLGYARLNLAGEAMRKLATLHVEADRFFSFDAAIKAEHTSSDFNFGFRPFGRQYSIAPDRLDLNESFTYRADTPEKIPGHERIASFVSALSDYWRVVAGIADSVLAETAQRLSSTSSVDFEHSSYIEINSYLETDERDLLQDRHEDGHLLTILTANAPGLEVELELAGGMTPVEFGQGELMLMPGSLLSDMTGAWISPLFHQVRNLGCPSRRSVLFLVDPPVEGSVMPFVVNETNRGLDIAERARTNSRNFGLPDAPVS
jgi:isopenicillin N synthase-like dioxygenase